MKKVLSITLIVILALSVLSAGFVISSVLKAEAEDNAPGLVLSDVSVRPGAAFDIYLGIKNNPGIISMRNKIIYDEYAFELVEVSDLSLLAGFTTPSPDVASPYVLRWADSLAVDDNLSNGNYARITFRCKETTYPGSYSISAEFVEARNSTGKKIAFESAEKLVLVSTSVVGDADGDGEVTDWDSILFERYLAGWDITEIDLGGMDLDHDDEITDWDSILLSRYLAGWDVTLTPKDTPVPSPEPTEAPIDDPNDPKVFKDTISGTVPLTNTHFHMALSDPSNPANESYTGFDVYAPVSGKTGYRYAPSIIYYPDGSCDAWFATPGMKNEWDWFTWKHSNDGGKTWSKEKIVLQPTPDSMDHYSVCDPGVIYFGGYYYLGYTSTIVSTNGGINNNVFVARSKNPDGPYEKWNGSGWGGDPQPIVYYNESDDNWGAGEPSFVLLDDTLYIYYTWSCDVGEYKYVSIADARDPNWPATMEFKGRAFSNPSGADQFDVVYVEDVGLFLGVQTAYRFTTSSGIQLWESKDGIHFIKGEFFTKNIAQYCHNMGISKRSNGHIQLKDNLFIGYAFAGGGTDQYWGKWATRFAFIELTTYQRSSVKTESSVGNLLISDSFWKTDSTIGGITCYDSSNNHFIKVNVGSSKTVNVSLVTVNISTSSTGTSPITFSNYDTSIISITGTSIKGLKEGVTEVTCTCRGFSTIFKVIVYAKGFSYGASNPTVASVRAVQDEVTIYNGRTNGANHKVQIRGFVEFSNGTWGECYNDATANHSSYPAMVPSEKFPVTYTSSDTSVATVDEGGMVTAKGIGTCVITATIGPSNKTFTMTVHVEAPPAEFNWTNTGYKW